jgi:peptidoglycan/LPS O-acetylase OafA/YrhL
MRALAAFLVFGWHFAHGFHGSPAAFGPGLIPALAPFNEGHCGVALFMCLSGYLFTKILDGKEVVWGSFYWNRLLRLAPLLITLFTINGIVILYNDPGLLGPYTAFILVGLVKPTWGFGAWSVTVEIHFYLLLWVLMPLSKRWAPSLLWVVAAALAARALIYTQGGDVAYYAYFTIFGRIDQFVLGMAAWHYRNFLRGKHLWITVAGVTFFVFYQWFASIGGYYGTQGNRAIWIFLPTIEAVFCSFLVAYYDSTFAFRRRWFWTLLQLVGTTSYSIYLLHTLVVFEFAKWANGVLPGMSTWEESELVAIPFFLAVMPFAWLSYRFVESPFLRFRIPYTRDGAYDKQVQGLTIPTPLTVFPSDGSPGSVQSSRFSQLGASTASGLKRRRPHPEVGQSASDATPRERS